MKLRHDPYFWFLLVVLFVELLCLLTGQHFNLEFDD